MTLSDNEHSIYVDSCHADVLLLILQFRFMKDIGMLMSKTEPSKAFVHILGCQWNEENAQETHSEVNIMLVKVSS